MGGRPEPKAPGHCENPELQTGTTAPTDNDCLSQQRDGRMAGAYPGESQCRHIRDAQQRTFSPGRFGTLQPLIRLLYPGG